MPFWLKQDQTSDSPLTSSLTSDDLSPGDVMVHCSTLVEAVVVANVTVFLGDLFVTGGVIIRVHYPILNMKKPPHSQYNNDKSDGFAWHAAFFSKTAQTIITHIYHIMVA